MAFDTRPVPGIKLRERAPEALRDLPKAFDDQKDSSSVQSYSFVSHGQVCISVSFSAIPSLVTLLGV
jgi:hypothetical protein